MGHRYGHEASCGRRHWTPSYRHLGADFFQVDAYSGKDAWALGVGGVARTTDGGGAWTWRPTGCPNITSIDFFSPRDGIAVAGASLLRTSDGGHRWRLNEPGPRWGRTRQLTTAYVQCAGPVAGWGELDVGDAAMNQSQHVGYHLAASGSRPLFAEGYFSSGALRRLPASPSSEPVTFSAISATEAAYLDYCAPCGNDGEAVVGVVTRTDHLGPSLRIRHIATATAGAFLSATNGWVVGSTSFATSRHQRWRIEHTADGGRTWTTQYQS